MLPKTLQRDEEREHVSQLKTQPSVFSIPAGTPFLDALAGEILNRHSHAPLDLPRVTVLLPTRRAVRGLREAFLRAGDGRPRLLPVMQPIGDVEEDELAVNNLGTGEDEVEQPTEISSLSRQMLLARLILSRSDGPDESVQALRLAHELGMLLDQVHTEELTFDALNDLVPEEFAAHWQLTLDFLKIVTENWPRILAERGQIDPADRRNRLIGALARRWENEPPPGPVIAAGSTGSIPATAQLLGVVAKLPQGSVVLPGLDTTLDDRTWDELDASHPQFGMKQLLGRMGVSRHEVELSPFLSSGGHSGDPLTARKALLSAALRPAETTDDWPSLRLDTNAALKGVSFVEAPGLTEEAGAIALMMREVLERPGQTAALVTPDRDLARRVAAELERWDVLVDDSAGVPLMRTTPGAYLRLTAELVAAQAAPVQLLAALKHPLSAGGDAPAEFRAKVRILESVILRGPRPALGFEGLRVALANTGANAPLIEWVQKLSEMAAQFSALLAQPVVEFGDLLRAHVDFAERLAASNDAIGSVNLWRGDAGEGAAEFICDVLASADPLPPVPPREYPALLDALMSTRVVRPRYGRHPRLQIWGPLEARLQHADLLILGGLNEGSWPPEAPNDPWLSRPMREKFGLPAPERRIGLSAHDFAQAANASRVVLCRSRKVGGGPTVPSRWLSRIKAFIGDALAGQTDQTAKWVGWHADLDTPTHTAPAHPPQPRPPVVARPRELSVTGIETWMRDPYSVYARRILKLKPLEALDADPGAAERGTFIHRALEMFVRQNGAQIPDDALKQLIEFGRIAFGDAMVRPTVWAFWWPRFLKVARWYVETEEVRRAEAIPIAVEVKGQLVVPAAAGPFVLTAKADRLDRLAAGGLEIIDYKTGAPPSGKKLETGYFPQLPLEALIAAAGGFEGVPADKVEALTFWRLSGGDPAGEIKPHQGAFVEELAAAAQEGLQNLINAFDRPETPYLCRPRPRPEYMGYGDYDHLARVEEWP